jgi:Toprim-like/Protein of unknown function (DUF3991)
MTSISDLRQLDLKVICINLGLQLDKSDKTQFKSDCSRIRINGFKWFDHHHRVGGGGAIDLTRHLLKLSFSEACRYLTTIEQDLYQAHKPNGESVEKRATTPPKPYSQNIGVIRTYLIEKRGLNDNLVNWCIQNSRVYADHKNNCVFRYGDKGAELRGTGERQWRSIYGTIEQGFILPAKNAAGIALLESAIDALSYRQLHKNIISISMAGNSNRKVIKQAVLIANERNIPLISAFDNDKGGNIADKTLNEIALSYNSPVIQDRPHKKDWNEQLKNMIY